jgi:hypothetical protein
MPAGPPRLIPVPSRHLGKVRSWPRGSASSNPGRGHGQQAGAAVGEHVQEVDGVEVGDHRVRQVNEGIRQQSGVRPGHLFPVS